MTDLPSPDECRARAARLRARALSQTTEPNVREALEEANVWEAIGAEMERRNFVPTAPADTKTARRVQRSSPVTREEHGRELGRARRLPSAPEIYAWLDELKKNSAWLASQVGVSPQMMRACIAGRQGKKRPEFATPRHIVQAVERLSKGRIRAEHWPHVS